MSRISVNVSGTQWGKVKKVKEKLIRIPLVVKEQMEGKLQQLIKSQEPRVRGGAGLIITALQWLPPPGIAGKAEFC